MSRVRKKQQEEEYRRRMLQRAAESEEMFAYKPESSSKKGIHQDKKCSECISTWAWYSSDFGKSWQCTEHRKK